MSYDLYIYGISPNVDKTPLTIEMLNRGWRMFLVSPPSEASEERHFLPTIGPLERSCTFVAWKIDARLAEQYENSLAEGDLSYFDLSPTSVSPFAVFDFSINTFDSAEVLGPDWHKKDATEAVAQAREALHFARWELTLRNAEDAPQHSKDFQNSCWYAMAALTGNYAVDPQTEEEFVGTPEEIRFTGFLGFLYKLMNPYTR